MDVIVFFAAIILVAAFVVCNKLILNEAKKLMNGEEKVRTAPRTDSSNPFKYRAAYYNLQYIVLAGKSYNPKMKLYTNLYRLLIVIALVAAVLIVYLGASSA